MTPRDTHFNRANKYRLIGILILFLAAFPITAFAQNDPEPAQTPTSIFSRIKSQFKKDIQTVRNVAQNEGKEIADRTRAESANTRKTATGMKTRPDPGRPDTTLSDH